jgi:outer membrane protein OmpA-like peptidoglycan-associated protein
MVWTIGLMGVSVASFAGEPPVSPKITPPQEPLGFITGGIIGGFAAGPIGAVVGAGIGTWLGNRVHRAGEASQAQARVALLESDKSQLQIATSALQAETGSLAETNRALTARLEQLSMSVQEPQTAKQDSDDAAKVLDGLEGDVLFRTGSAEISPEMAEAIQVLAEAVAKSPDLKVRVDGYADARGSVGTNLKLSEARANAVRDLFLAAGVAPAALEVNAYGKSQSSATDSDGYAFERRVRLTLQADGSAAVAQANDKANVDKPAGLAPVTENE